MRGKGQVRRGERGFSLIELMVASTVFTVGLLSITALQLGTANGLEESGDLSMATNLATSKLDSMRLADFTTFATGQTGTEYFDRFGGDNPAEANRHFTLSWNIVDTASGLTATVVVAWIRQGKTKRVTLQSILMQVRPT